MPKKKSMATNASEPKLPARRSSRVSTSAVQSKISIPNSSEVSIQRPGRIRKARTIYSPATPRKRPKKGRQTTTTSGSWRLPVVNTTVAANIHEPNQPTGSLEYKKLEGKIKSQVTKLRYLLTFMEAYETEGWRKTNAEKLKPSKELAIARKKFLATKRVVLDTLKALQQQNVEDPQLPELLYAEPGSDVAPESIYCSRCESAETQEDNDILICDNAGCHRAYHQQCQTPWVRTNEIPEGVELWYCEVCHAVFNSLKIINSAFGTTYETVDEVFPKLTQEENEFAAAMNDESDTGSAQTVDESDNNDEDDEDFVDRDSALGSDSVSGSDDESGTENGDGSEEEVIEEDKLSDQELKYLRADAVLDHNRRSMRSHNPSTSKDKQEQQQSTFLGKKVATVDSVTGNVVFGVVVEELIDEPSSEELMWRVVYYNNIQADLSRDQVEQAMACAEQYREQEEQEEQNLIIHGKRKRNAVNYRALNDLIFAGKADSDAEANDSDDYKEDEDESEDEKCINDSPRTVTTNLNANAKKGTNGKQTRRRRRTNVDYRTLHEGVLST